MRVLVIEDERKVADAISEGLQAERYDVVVERTGDAGHARIATGAFDLILLDLGLPGRSGLEILSSLRGRGLNVPVLVLTARDGVDDRVRALDAGADDYVVKPFAFAELLARMRALFRRGRPGGAHQLTVGPVSIDLLTRRVTRDGEVIELTVREFELLEYLMRYQGQVVSRDTIAREIWKEVARTTPLDNVIHVHMARLRRKIDTSERGRLIHTIRGVGFMVKDGEP